MEAFKFRAHEAVRGEVGKIVAEDAGDVRRQAVVGDDVDEQPSINQMLIALRQESLFVACLAAVFIQHREVGRVE